MSKCNQPPSSAQRHLTAYSTTTVYEWFTGWTLAMGLRAIKAAIKRRGADSTFRCQLAMQVAPVRTDKPNAPTVIGSMVADNGETCTSVVDVTAATDGNYFVRFGIAYSVTTGSTTAQADVSLDLSDDGCGSGVGSANVLLQTVGVGNSYLAISAWLSALQAQKLKLAIVCSSLTGNFQWRVCFRLATTSTQVPGAWTTTFDEWRTAGEFCTGELTPTGNGTEMWIQVGIQYNLSSGSVLGQASIQALLAASKA